MIQYEEIKNKYTSTGRHSGYSTRVYHTGLMEAKNLTASEMHILQDKINNQTNLWNKKWELTLSRQTVQAKKDYSQEISLQHKMILDSINSILISSLENKINNYWELLKDKTTFSIEPPYKPFKRDLPHEPRSEYYLIKPSFLTKILGKAKKLKQTQETLFKLALDIFNEEKNQLEKSYQSAIANYNNDYSSWEAKLIEFNDKQANFNNLIDQKKLQYYDSNPEYIIEYCKIILNNSQYPVSFTKCFNIQYNKINQMLFIDYQLPHLDNIPKIGGVKYIITSDVFIDKNLSATELHKLYDSTIYQITLRTLSELFNADKIDAIRAIIFNGIITNTNQATGHQESKCIVSIQANKTEFLAINLSQVDPKACFKSLKGIGSAKLYTITPIQPLIELDKSDSRFIEHYDVTKDINETTNLAAMDWEDFEHLVREIFEKEFSQNGGEVKVTHASSDGGVDAIAFDPDPLRGGKVVIQAKRYTNTVGVSAVRDLYGTLMNEGANKGILVTTSDFGHDSYEFVKNKPLTLLNGSNLLHLLQKHGHSATINIKEAKLLLKNNV